MQPGTCLGDRYAVDLRIGSGEHGSVWLGRDTVLDRLVRIKVLDPGLARDETVRARFRRTALAVASLDVPGVAEVFDCVEERDGENIIVCQIGERVDGEPLSRLLLAKTFNSEDALALVAQVAHTLHDVHEQGLRHLNLKSSNLFIGADATVRMVDFGFTAPGEVADDVSALGSLAYECLAGAKPFKVEPDAPPEEQERQPQPLPANVAPAVAVFVKRALSTDPAKRFSTAAQLAVECEQINHTQDVLGALLERTPSETGTDSPDEAEGPVGLGSRLDAVLTPADPAESDDQSEPMPVRPGGSGSATAAPAAAATADDAEPGTPAGSGAAAGPPAAATGPLRAPSEPPPPAGPKPRKRKRLVLVAVLLLFVAFAGTTAVMTLLPGEPASSADEGDGKGLADPQDTSPITTGPPPSRGGDEAGNDPSESDSPSGSDSPSPSDGEDGGDDGGGDGDDDDNDGPDEPARVQVPDVVGDDPRSAYDELRAAGLEVDVNKSGRGEHACPVHQQSPGGGTTVDKGSTVDISVRMVKKPHQCEDGGGD